MTTYYVDALSGNDSHAGTSPATAWKSVAKVNQAALVAGDNVLFARGQTWSGTQLTISWSGTNGNPITFGAYGSGPQPILSAGDWSIPNLSGGSNYNKNTIYNIAHSYITYQDLDLRNGYSSCCYNDGASLSAGVYTLTAVVDINVVNCTLSGAGNDNVLFIHNVSGTIDGCESFGANNYLQIYGGVSQVATGIEVADGGTVTVKNCRVHDCPTSISVHCHPEPAAGTALAAAAPNGFAMPVVTMQDTPSTNCGMSGTTSNGISLANGLSATNPQTGSANPLYVASTILVDRCPVYNQTFGSSLAIGRDLTTASNLFGNITVRRSLFNSPNAVYNADLLGDNIVLEYCQFIGQQNRLKNSNGTRFYNCDLHVQSGATTLLLVDQVSTYGGTSTDLVVKNCIFGSGDGTAIPVKITQAAVTAGLTAPTFDHNIYQSTGSRWYFNADSSAKTFTAWKAAGLDGTGSSAGVDPLFTGPASGALALQATSPAIGAAAVLAGINDQYASPDVGALQRVRPAVGMVVVR